MIFLTKTFDPCHDGHILCVDHLCKVFENPSNCTPEYENADTQLPIAFIIPINIDFLTLVIQILIGLTTSLAPWWSVEGWEFNSWPAIQKAGKIVLVVCLLRIQDYRRDRTRYLLNETKSRSCVSMRT